MTQDKSFFRENTNLRPRCSFDGHMLIFFLGKASNVCAGKKAWSMSLKTV